MAFTPKIKKARFVVSGYSAEQMLAFGQSLADHIKKRIQNGDTVDDTESPALTPRYAKFKVKRGGQDLRDLTLTGRTMRALRPLSASENRVEVGFSDPVAARRVRFNSRIARQFGASPSDRKFIGEEISISKNKPVKVQQVA